MYILIVLMFLFITGCVTISPDMRKNFEDKRYVKKDNLIFYSRNPQYYDLKDTISKQEYRILPSYLQEYYKEESW